MQMAEELNLKECEVTEAIEKLEEDGMIKITQVSRKTIVNSQSKVESRELENKASLYYGTGLLFV